MQPTYAMQLKDRSTWYLDKDGGILLDGSRQMKFDDTAGDSRLKVVSLSRIIQLAGANGDLSARMVHDLDYGRTGFGDAEESARRPRVVDNLDGMAHFEAAR